MECLVNRHYFLSYIVLDLGLIVSRQSMVSGDLGENVRY